jgi:cell division protein FtsB
MKDLQEEQRKMRERMQATQRKRTATSTKSSLHAELPETKDIQALLKRIEVLEAENTLLRRQLSKLRDQSVPPERRSEMSENERRHLFMKYSNVRRY